MVVPVDYVSLPCLPINDAVIGKVPRRWIRKVVANLSELSQVDEEWRGGNCLPNRLQ